MIWRNEKPDETQRKYARLLIRYFASRAGELAGDESYLDAAAIEKELLSCDYGDVVKEEFSSMAEREKAAVGFGLLYWVPFYTNHYESFDDTLVGIARDIVELKRVIGDIEKMELKP